MQIYINGEPRDVVPDLTVARLLADLKLEPRYLAVERNLVLIPRRQHADCVLQAEDRVEIVTLVGGG
ncbi:MAG: sulfur carrier protein ThiS [Planctomycetota bacterium]|nr:sulfur carrier protein ThiS [Planctomycetota bacterium]